MAAGTVDLNIEQDATYRAAIIWKTGTPALPVNITGYSARMMMKTTPVKDASLIIGITKANPGVVTTKAAHGLKTEQSVVLPNVLGMTGLTGRYTITVLSATTFSIGIDTSAFTTYTSGGSVAFVSLTGTLGNDGQLVLGTTGGDVAIYIKDSVTDLMSGGGVYDLEMISPSPVFDVTRLIQGNFTVSLNTTR